MNATAIAEILRRHKPVPLPCTERSGRCADARDHRCELRHCCRGHLVTLVAAAASVLNELGGVWWADYGTLLGAVRNPLTTWADYPWLSQEGRETAGPAAGIVPHDKDADLGVMFGAYDSVLRGLRALPNHRARPFLTEHSIKLELSVHNQTNADLFFWEERPDGVLLRKRYASVDQYKGREFHRDMLYPLTTVQWEGLTLPAPRDPEAFLAMRYGENWRTPLAANHDGVKRG